MSHYRILPAGHFQPQARTWRDRLSLLKDAYEAFQRDQGIMTEFERTVISRDLQSEREKHYAEIFRGIYSEFETTISNYQTASARILSERQKEISRWNSARLREEMDLAEALIGQAIKSKNSSFGGQSPSAALEAIYQEARASGDLHKMRGAAEVFKAALASVNDGSFQPSDRLAVNRLAKQAETDLSALRVTDDMRRAEDDQRQALDAMMNKREELLSIGQALDGGDPRNVFSVSSFARAARRVGFQDGEIHVFAPDAPEVTGVDLSKLSR